MKLLSYEVNGTKTPIPNNLDIEVVARRIENFIENNEVTLDDLEKGREIEVEYEELNDIFGKNIITLVYNCTRVREKEFLYSEEIYGNFDATLYIYNEDNGDETIISFEYEDLFVFENIEDEYGYYGVSRSDFY